MSRLAVRTAARKTCRWAVLSSPACATVRSHVRYSNTLSSTLRTSDRPRADWRNAHDAHRDDFADERRSGFARFRSVRPAAVAGRDPEVRSRPGLSRRLPRYRGTGVLMSTASHRPRPITPATTVALAVVAAGITVWLGFVAHFGGMLHAGPEKAAVQMPDRLAVVRVEPGETLQHLAARVAPDAPTASGRCPHPRTQRARLVCGDRRPDADRAGGLSRLPAATLDDARPAAAERRYARGGLGHPEVSAAKERPCIVRSVAIRILESLTPAKPMRDRRFGAVGRARSAAGDSPPWKPRCWQWSSAAA